MAVGVGLDGCQHLGGGCQQGADGPQVVRQGAHIDLGCRAFVQIVSACSVGRRRHAAYHRVHRERRSAVLARLEAISVRTMYMTATVLKGGKTSKVEAWNSLARWVMSLTERTDSSEVSLSMAMNSLPSGGTTMRRACGRTTWRAVCQLLRPRLRDASICPEETASMPALKISAM